MPRDMGRSGGSNRQDAAGPVTQGAVYAALAGWLVGIVRYGAWAVASLVGIALAVHAMHPVSSEPWSDLTWVPWLLAVPVAFLCWALVPVGGGRSRALYRLALPAAWCAGAMASVGTAIALGDDLFGIAHAVLCWLLLMWAPGRRAGPADVAMFRWATIVGVGGGAMAFLVASEGTASDVLDAAGKVAGGAPYCVQVEAGAPGDYRPVPGRADLSALKRQAQYAGGASHTVKVAYDAVVEVTRDGKVELWAWEDGKGLRLADPRAAKSLPRDRCRPSTTYAEDLPTFGPSSP